MRSIFYFVSILLLMFSCIKKPEGTVISEAPFLWENATVYFMLTDRFQNGDPGNDLTLGRQQDAAFMRGFMGGDISGITQKIESGYFDSLGVNAIWFTPVFEQIHGYTDEGTGKTYAFHGYWPKDWTALDPNFGTWQDLGHLVQVARQHKIRILMDVIINHTGPVTERDPAWPDEWVRLKPRCTYTGYETTVPCTVAQLPDIKTESDSVVALPDQLVQKWEQEGRLEQEVAELDAFFEQTGYPRAPRYYIIKWLVDLIKEYGIDGFRVDTAKHTEAFVWGELYKEALAALRTWKQQNPDLKLDDLDFYMVGEVYNYNISSHRIFNYGDSAVDFFRDGFKAMINFEFKSDVARPYEETFSKYSNILNGEMQGLSVLNYISSHDDGSPFDRERQQVFRAGTALMLTPGAVQIYYGDETARLLNVEGAEGDANLRSMMNWDELEQNISRNGYTISDVHSHWSKLGIFRKEHPSVGAGVHEMLSEEPYVFKRTLNNGGYHDQVVVSMGGDGNPVNVYGVFEDGTVVKNYFTGEEVEIENGMANFTITSELVLIGQLL